MESPFPIPSLYKRVVGKLLYLGFLRSGICNSIQQQSKYMHQPSVEHWKSAMHLLQYCKNNINLWLHFAYDNPSHLKVYCDADWGNCLDTRRSLTGYCLIYGNSLVVWETKKQTEVSKSTIACQPLLLRCSMFSISYMNCISHYLSLWLCTVTTTQLGMGKWDGLIWYPNPKNSRFRSVFSQITQSWVPEPDWNIRVGDRIFNIEPEFSDRVPN